MSRSKPLLCWQALHVPKRGHTADEYEDAWAVDEASGRFAVADGASESSFAGLWARLLVESFVAARRPRDLHAWLDESRRRWAAEVMGLELPWYGEMKRQEGAFATLLGVALRPPASDRPGRLQAVAVGDSCLVRVRAGRQVRAFPLQKAAEFGNRPSLVCSQTEPTPTPQYASASLLGGDRLFLMTDALAEWFLRVHERGELPWDAVLSLLTAPQIAEAFATWVEALRDEGALRNDDVTLLTVAVEPTAPTVE